MALPSWDVFVSNLDNFRKMAEMKKKAFEGYDKLLDISIKTSLLYLPDPVSVLAEYIYEKTPGPVSTKIDKVNENLERIEKLGEDTFTQAKGNLDVILDRLAGTDFDVIVPNSENTVEKVLHVLVAEDRNTRADLIAKLNNLVNSLPG